MKTKNQGFALIVALMVVLIVSTLIAGLLFNVNTSLNVIGNDLKAAYAKSFAEVGLNKYQTILQQTYNFYKEGDRWKEYENALTAEQLELVKCGYFTAIGLDLDRIRDGETINPNTGEKYRTGNSSFDLPVNGFKDESYALPDGVKGGYVVRLSGDGLIIESQGYLGESLNNATAKATARVSFQVQSAGSAWQNAVFADKEAIGNNNINGSTAIYGSVHITGNSNPALTLSGSAGVFNDYSGEGSSNSNSNIIDEMNAIAGPGQQNVNLCAEVKIKQGELHFGSGGATVGTASSPIIATYLGGGTNDEDQIHAGGMFNYTNSLDVEFPLLAETYPNEYNNNIIDEFNNVIEYEIINLGGAYCDKFQTGQGQNINVQFPPPGANQNADPPYTGCLSEAGIGSQLQQGGIGWLPDALACNLTNIQDAINGIVTNSSGNATGDGYLCVAGSNVVINTGAMPLEIKYPGGNNKTVYYEGKASVRTGSEICTDPTAAPPCTRRDIEIRENFIPRNPGAAPYFPEDSIISLVANGDVLFAPKGGGGSTSNLEVAAAVYAQGTAIFSKQTLVVGSVLADSFNATNQVPKIAYEPRVPDNIPNGSPGAGATLNQNIIASAYEYR